MESYVQLSLWSYQWNAPARQKFTPGGRALREQVHTCRPAWNDGYEGLERLAERMVNRMRYADALELRSFGGQMIRVEYVSLARHGGHYRIIYQKRLHLVHTMKGQKHMTEQAREVLAKWLIEHVTGDLSREETREAAIQRGKAALLAAEWDTALTPSRNARHDQPPVVLL